MRRNLSASMLSLGLTAARVSSALAINKIMAIFLGPGGLALVGQFQNFTAVAFGITSGNITNAVVSTVAASHDEEGRRRAVGTSIAATSLGALVIALVITVASAPLATAVLGRPELAPVMMVFAVAMLPAIAHVVVLAVLLGMGASGTFALIQVALAIASVPACWLLVTQAGLAGALLSAVVVSAAMILVTLLWIARKRVFPLRWMMSGIHGPEFRKLARLAGMSLSTLIAIPVAQLLVRQEIFEGSGADAAGQWQAALKMGEVLLMLTSAIVAIQFLPKFSARPDEAAGLVGKATWSVVAVLSPVAVVTIVASQWLVPMLLTREFSAATDLLPMQFAGDILRGVMTIPQAAFMAQSRSRSYVSVDLVYATSLVVAAYLLVPRFGAEGASWAAAIGGALGAAVAIALACRMPRARKAQ